MTHRAAVFSFVTLAAAIAACSNRAGLIPPATAQPAPGAASPAGRKTTLNVTLNLSQKFAAANRLTISAYVLPPSGPAATPPPSSVVSSFNVSGAACRSTAGGRTCRFTARVPTGLDGVIVNLYQGKTMLVGNAFLATSAGPTPASATFRTGGKPKSLLVVTPVLAGASDFGVAVMPLAGDGSVILNNNGSSHTTVRVYAPAGAVTGSSSDDGVPSATVGGAGVSAGFHYSGAAFANAMTVTAVRGTNSITGQIYPARTPAPRACAKLGDTNASRVSETSPVTKGFFLRVSIAGGPRTQMQVDTGSMGLLIDAPYIAGADRSQLVGPGQAGQETLEPSNVTLKGNYYLAPVTLYGGGKTIGTTVPMEVLVVSQACVKNVCKPDTGSHYLGVGFGRPTPAPTTGYLKSPLQNVLLQLSAIVRGTMHPGYILANDSLTVGIDRTNAAGYAFTSLAPFPGRTGDWQTPPGCIGFNGGKFQCGTMLLDVGIDTMFVSAPTPGPVNEISIAAPDTTNPSLAYSFAYPVEPGATPPAPNPRASVPIVFQKPGAAPSFNTGRGPLAIRSYLFDSACGRTGFHAY
jgi:hypothetical protein